VKWEEMKEPDASFTYWLLKNLMQARYFLRGLVEYMVLFFVALFPIPFYWKTHPLLLVISVALVFLGVTRFLFWLEIENSGAKGDNPPPGKGMSRVLALCRACIVELYVRDLRVGDVIKVVAEKDCERHEGSTAAEKEG